ncbi:MAG: hypothetical protein ACK5KL_15270 [Dysgonomonas sp.]
MKFYFLLFFLILGTFFVSAQKKDQYIVVESANSPIKMLQGKYDNSFLSHLSVALRASTMGIGVQAATPINDNFTLRAGLDLMNFKTGNIDISLDDPDGAFDKALGYTPDYKMKGKLNLVHGNALVDFYPTKGVFHLTAGFYLGTNKVNADGILVDPNGDKAVLKPGESWPSINFDGHQLEIDDANLNAELQLGNTIKPYLGIGIGRAIAHNRISFKFELGALYQGDYTLKQNGKKIDVNNNLSENFDDVDKYTNLLKWWPMLNFQISYRIF